MEILLILAFVILAVTVPGFLLLCLLIILAMAIVIAWFWSLGVIGEYIDPIMAIILGVLSLFSSAALITIIIVGSAISFFSKDVDDLLAWLWIFVLVILILL